MRTVLITGAARGIGAACAEVFRERGDHVIAVDRPEADLTKRDEVERLFQNISSLDVLVANAGVPYSLTTSTASQEQYEQCLAENLQSVWWCCRLARPLLAASGRGAIVTMASAHGLQASKASFPYSVAKGGLLALTRTLAVEYAPAIRVNAIVPGQIESVRTEGYFAQFRDPAAARRRVEQTFPLRRLGQPEEIAKAAYFLASDDASYITGTILHVDGGRHAALPDLSDLEKTP
jgi:NAD(P)-dependent dehydrogenase (short-subunit alcohol dehydrogenase family)